MILSSHIKKHTWFSGVLLFFLLIFCKSGITQYNLVPNPSFEQFTICPSAIKSDKPDIWYKPDKGGAAYRNNCSQLTTAGVPYHFTVGGTGFQYPRIGFGYVFMFYYNTGSHNYFQIKLKDSLKAGHCYYSECYVNLSNPFKLACNNQGILLTRQAIYVDTANAAMILPANPQIVNYGNSIISDTLNWVKVSSVFTASGGEQYLTLGNFKDDNNTSFKVVNPTGGYKGAAYYVDDVSLYALDSFPLKADAGPDTTITLGDSVFIGSLTNGIPNITWYNMAGNVIDTGRPGFFVHPTVTTSYIIEQTVCGYYSRDTVTVTVNVMPLHWLGLSLTPGPSPWGEGRKTTLLRWQTANEFNVSHFNIQRSYRGTNEFENVGQVSANNKPYNEYSFVDDEVNVTASWVLYRLQSVDKDGMRSYSEIRRVRFENDKARLLVYPNPTTGILNIEYKEIKGVSLMDVTGREIMKKAWHDGGNKIQLDISNLPRGLYIIKAVNSDTNIQSQKFIKNNR